MTIRDVAQLTGVSVTAVYKRIRARKLSLDELMDPKTKQLTEDGERAVLSLFDGQSIQPGSKPVLNQVDNQVLNQIDEFKTRLKTVEEENTQLKTDLAAARAEAQGLREQVVMITDRLNATQKSLDQAQALQLLAMQKIPPALPAPKQGIFSRLFHRQKGGVSDGNT